MAEKDKGKAARDGTKRYQVARGRSIRVGDHKTEGGPKEFLYPAYVELPAKEGDALVADGFLVNPRTEAELADAGVNIGLEGKGTVGPAVLQGKDLPGPDDE